MLGLLEGQLGFVILGYLGFQVLVAREVDHDSLLVEHSLVFHLRQAVALFGVVVQQQHVVPLEHFLHVLGNPHIISPVQSLL